MASGVFWFVGSVTVAGVGFLGRAYIMHRGQCRRECRDQIDRATSLVNSIEEYAVEYYCQSPDAQDAARIARQISSKLKQLGDRITRINATLRAEGLLTAVVAFRRAVSSELDVQGRRSYAPDDAMFEKISSSGRMLITKLEREFQHQYGGFLW